MYHKSLENIDIDIFLEVSRNRDGFVFRHSFSSLLSSHFPRKSHQSFSSSIYYSLRTALCVYRDFSYLLCQSPYLLAEAQAWNSKRYVVIDFFPEIFRNSYFFGKKRSQAPLQLFKDSFITKILENNGGFQNFCF